MAGHPHFPSNIDKILSLKKKRIGVWERKSEDEIEFEQIKLRRSAFSLIMPTWAFFLVAFGLFFIRFNLKGLNLYNGFLISSLVFVCVYLLQIRTGRSFAKSPRFRICKDCLTEDWIGLKQCQCGGVLEPVEFYNFIEKSK